MRRCAALPARPPAAARASFLFLFFSSREERAQMLRCLFSFVSFLFRARLLRRSVLLRHRHASSLCARRRSRRAFFFHFLLLQRARRTPPCASAPGRARERPPAPMPPFPPSRRHAARRAGDDARPAIQFFLPPFATRLMPCVSSIRRFFLPRAWRRRRARPFFAMAPFAYCFLRFCHARCARAARRARQQA